MYRTITPEEMKRVERAIMQETGLPGLLLMEHAAMAVVKAVRRLMRGRQGQVLFLCGPGNNGGDGLAAARLWMNAGGQAQVWQLTSRMTGDAGVNRQLLKKLWPETPVVRLSDTADKLPPIGPEIGCIVDALFGTGLNQPVQGVAYALIKKVNESGLPVVAVDIPSGLSGLTGMVMGEAVRAFVTVTFHRPKIGLYLNKGPEYAGRVKVADIGLSKVMDDAPGMDVLLPKDLGALLPPRRRDTHKGDYGRVLVVAGSAGMAGAASICALSALRTGAGLVTVACPENVVPIVQQVSPCATCLPLPMEGAAFAREAENLVYEAALRADAVAVGPGLGAFPDRLPLLQAVKRAGKPAVWDADALNLLAVSRDMLPMAGTNIFTPHPGEAARLMQVSAGAVTADAAEAVQALWQTLGGVVLLKGATTLLYDGSRLAVNITGTPALAKGGSGDALTGILAALLAQGKELGHPPLMLAQIGCCLHGHAARRAEKATGQRGLLATDLTWYLGKEPVTRR